MQTCSTCNNFDGVSSCSIYNTDKTANCYCMSHTEEKSVTIEDLDRIVDKANNILKRVPRMNCIERKNFIEPHSTWEIYDASKVNEYMMCPRRFFYRYVLGWTSESRSHDLDFGSAWHIAMEHLLLNGYGKDQILEAYAKFRNFYEAYWPIEDQAALELAPKTSSHALLALTSYVEKYLPHDYFKVLYTEVSGSINVLNNRIMHFRIDAIIEDDTGVATMEHKTTKTLERTFVDKWELDTQPNLYSHVLHCLFPDKHVKGVIINGACLHKQGPRSKKPPAEFLRVPVYRSSEMMNTWIQNNEMWLAEIERDYDTLSGESDADSTMTAFKQNSTSCTDFWGCRFHDFCISWANPLQYCHDVPTGFIQQYWNPAEPEDHPPAKYAYRDGQIEAINKEGRR